MADETKADPAALRAYSADMRARLATTRDALADYQMAIAAFNAAPKEEVEHTIPDRSGAIAADLDWLALVDVQPELFAEALEAADRTAFSAGLLGEGLYQAAVQQAFLDRLAVEDPDAHTAVVEQLRAEAVARARADDPGFVEGFAGRLFSYDPQQLAQEEVDRLNAQWETRLFGPSYFATEDGRIEPVQEMGLGSAARGIWAVLRRGPKWRPTTPLPRPPVVTTGKLNNVLKELYHGGSNPYRIRGGTTMDAVRYELATGKVVYGRGHIAKARNSKRALDKWLRQYPDAPYLDRLIARSIRDELDTLLKGVG